MRARRRLARPCSRPGLPDTTSATTINRVCGSGLKAIMLAAAEIRAGDAEVAIAGGMESMNGAPYLLPGARFGYRLGNARARRRDRPRRPVVRDRGLPHGHPRRTRRDQGPRQPRGPGRVRAGQPPEGDRRHRRRSVRRRDGAGDRPRREGPRDRRLGRRGAAARLDVPRRSPGSSRSSTSPTARIAATRPRARSRPATPPASRTAPPRRSSRASAPWSGSG